MARSAVRAEVGGTPRIRVREFDPYRPVHVTIPSTEEHLAEVRRLIARVSTPTWLTGDDIAELKLAATEACLNAIRHGSPHGNQSHVQLTLKPFVDQMVVEVRDEGLGFDPRRQRQRAFPLAGETGRGVKLIDSLVDRAEYHRTHRGQIVRLTKRSRLVRHN